jgi:DNA-binding SARP family transcriptional activator
MVDEPLSATNDLSVTTLGAFGVTWGGRAVPSAEWSRKRAAALFRALVGAPGFRLGADAVIERLWPESTPLAGRTNLRVKIFEIRAILARNAPPGVDPLAFPPVLFEGGVVAFDPRYGPHVDAYAFERAGVAALERDDDAAVLRALESYGGPYLPEERCDATLALRERFARVHRALGLRAARILAAAPDRVERLLAPLFSAYPFDEEVALALASVRAALGRRVDLRDLYLDHERALRERSGLAPSERLAALAGVRIDHSGNGRAASERVRPATNGHAEVAHVVHRAKSDIPNGVTARKLPPLVGRSRELATAERALDAIARGARVVGSIAGPGGVGKSRFAREVETLARSRGFAVAFARAFRDVPADMLVDEILDALRTSDGDGLGYADDVGALGTALANARRERPALVILDDAASVPQAVRVALAFAAGAAAPHGCGVFVVARDLDAVDAFEFGAPVERMPVALEALDPDSVRAIVAASFDGAVDAALLALLSGLWPGDVALALAAAAHVRANGTATVAGGVWQLRAGSEAFDVLPERNRLGIVRRILALDAGAVETVKALAFAGDRATRETVALLTARDAHEAGVAFATIEQAGLGAVAGETLVLPHAVRAVAGEMLSRRRRSLFVERLAGKIVEGFR